MVKAMHGGVWLKHMAFRKISCPDPNTIAIFTDEQARNYESAYVTHQRYWADTIRQAEISGDLGALLLSEALAEMLAPYADAENRANENKQCKQRQTATPTNGLRTLALSLLVRSQLEMQPQKSHGIGLYDIAADNWAYSGSAALPLHVDEAAADAFYGFKALASSEWCQQGQLIVQRNQVGSCMPPNTELNLAYLAPRN